MNKRQKRVGCFTFLAACAMAAPPQTVHFMSEDGQTLLTGYVFEPTAGGQHPGVVMLHGRAGAYSSLAKGVYTAATLSKRHAEWGNFWSSRGYVAVLVDSFSPRGYAEGFPRGSYENRPAAVSEQTVRPLDAYAALRYLRTRPDVIPDRIGLQGWSNGAMTTLVTMSERTPGIDHPTPAIGFRVALAEYPGCGMEVIKGEYRNYAPLLMELASADEEVSPKICEEFAARAKKSGATLEVVTFQGAEHNFDDPETKKQSNPANRRAKEETMQRAESLFASYLMRP
jgi:dienelactone hydrolase